METFKKNPFLNPLSGEGTLTEAHFEQMKREEGGKRIISRCFIDGVVSVGDKVILKSISFSTSGKSFSDYDNIIKNNGVGYAIVLYISKDDIFILRLNEHLTLSVLGKDIELYEPIKEVKPKLNIELIEGHIYLLEQVKKDNSGDIIKVKVVNKYNTVIFFKELREDGEEEYFCVKVEDLNDVYKVLEDITEQEVKETVEKVDSVDSQEWVDRALNEFGINIENKTELKPIVVYSYKRNEISESDRIISKIKEAINQAINK
jgi:hypothetical protein